MKKSEAIELIMYVQEKWGHAAAPLEDEAQLALRAQVWVDTFVGIDARVVRAVVVQAQDEFPPNVGIIHRRCDEMMGIRRLPDWDELWRWISIEASRSSLYLYDDAPTLVCPWPDMEGVITVGDLTQWARDGMTSHDFEMVVQAHVRRHYEARVARIRREGMAELPIVKQLRAELATEGRGDDIRTHVLEQYVPSTGVVKRIDELPES